MVEKKNQIRLQEGPQEEFGSSPADIVIYGGAAGGGKSFGLVFEAGRNADVPGYHGIIFRRTSPQLTGGGSVWEESSKIYPYLGGVPKEHKLTWKFPENSSIEFSHLQHNKDKHSHQSKQYAFIGFDELTQFTEDQFWYLFSRNRSTCGVQPYIRAATNPDPDSWVRDFIGWWINEETGYPIKERSGMLRWFVRDGDRVVWGTKEELLEKYPDQDKHRVTSVTFIAAKLQDNPALTEADPQYMSRLLALPRVEREQLLHGNWNIRPAAGNYFKRSYFEVIDVLPAKCYMPVRAWDKAATKPSATNPDPDYTSGVKMCTDEDGMIYIMDMVETRDSPHGVDQLIKNTASQDGKGLCTQAFWQDPGAAGKADISATTRMLAGHIIVTERATKDKETYAKPLSSQAEAGNVKILRGPWNKRYMEVMEAFPDGAHDDPVDASSLGYLKCVNNDLDFLRKMAKR